MWLSYRKVIVVAATSFSREIERKNLSLLMAYLSQKISLLSMSLLQNAELISPESNEEDLQKALRMAKVLEEIEAMEQEVRVSASDVRASPAQRLGRMLFGFEPRRVGLMERREGLDRLAGNEFGNLHSGGRTLRTYVPREVCSRFSPELKLLYRHIAEGEEGVLQPEDQHKAARAQFVDQSALRAPGCIGDNSHVVAGAMSVEEWERSHAKSKR